MDTQYDITIMSKNGKLTTNIAPYLSIEDINMLIANLQSQLTENNNDFSYDYDKLINQSFKFNYNHSTQEVTFSVYSTDYNSDEIIIIILIELMIYQLSMLKKDEMEVDDINELFS